MEIGLDAVTEESCCLLSKALFWILESTRLSGTENGSHSDSGKKVKERSEALTELKTDSLCSHSSLGSSTLLFSLFV